MNEKPRLLLAEDDENQRDFLSTRLESAGFAVTTAEKGDVALREARKERFDAIISDLEMPGRSGLDVIRELSGDVPVVLVSGALTPETRRRAMADGAAAVLPKPIVWTDLHKVLEQVVTRRNEKRRAIVADDHEGTRMLLETILRGAGFEVDLASDGQEALDKIEAAERPYDLLITDILMPRIEGPELIRRIHGLDARTRVVFTTGAGSRTDIRRCYEEGGVSFWRKPFDVKRITDEIRRWRDEPPPAPREQDPKKLSGWLSHIRGEIETDKEKKVAFRKGVVFLVAAVLLVIVLTVLDQFYGIFGSAVKRVDSFMQRMEGYMERDEMREIERDNRSRPR